MELQGVGIGMLANATKIMVLLFGGEALPLQITVLLLVEKAQYQRMMVLLSVLDLTQVQLNRLLLVMVLVLQLLMVLQ